MLLTLFITVLLHENHHYGTAKTIAKTRKVTDHKLPH